MNILNDMIKHLDSPQYKQLIIRNPNEFNSNHSGENTSPKDKDIQEGC